MLEPLIDDLVTLERHGLFIEKLGKTVKGTVQCIVADNLGAHSIAGFVENFSGKYVCRFCTAEKKNTRLKKLDLKHSASELKNYILLIFSL